MRQVIVTRFSVPRPEAANADRHQDPSWLAERLRLFRRFFVPSVERLGVPTILLASTASAERLAREIADLEWATVEVQDDWRDGWRGDPDQMVTRLDSDDALHEGWFEALERAPRGYDAYCTRRFLRLDLDTGWTYSYKRREPSPLVGFAGGANPYRHDHADLPRFRRVFHLREPYLLQVVHGGNLSNRRPSWRRYFQRVSPERLAPFGLDPEAVSHTGSMGS